MVSFAELRRLCSGWISHGMDSFGGHGAFRLGLVRFGWVRSGKAVTVRKAGCDALRLAPVRYGKSRRFCFGLVRWFMVRSGRARSDLVRRFWCVVVRAGALG